MTHFILKLGVIIVGACLWGTVAHAVTLNQTAVVYDNTIKAGDIFSGLEGTQKAVRVLGVAPQAGQDMTLSARTLLRVAKAMDLEWRPMSAAETVTVTRAATIVHTGDIVDGLQSHLQAQNQDTYTLSLDGHIKDIVLPHDTSTNFTVQSLDITPTGKRFTAQLSFAGEDKMRTKTHKVSGVINRMVDVPVLRRALSKGDVISRHDLDIKAMPESAVKGNAVLSADDMIGMTPRGAIHAGKIIKSNDLEAPLAIKRGAFVTMTFNHGALQLSAQGKAMENGVIGDVVRVTNTASNKVVQAKVIGDQQVTVMTF